jgi:hypothetical protein
LTAGALLSITKDSYGLPWDLDCLKGLIMPWLSSSKFASCIIGVKVKDFTKAGHPLVQRECILLPEELPNVFVGSAGVMGVGLFAKKDHDAGVDIARVRGWYFPINLGTRLLENLQDPTFFPNCESEARGLPKRISPYLFTYSPRTGQIVDFHMAWSAAAYVNSCQSPNGDVVPHNCSFHIAQTDEGLLTITTRTTCQVKKVN